jgi:hypothetical protein
VVSVTAAKRDNPEQHRDSHRHNIRPEQPQQFRNSKDNGAVGGQRIENVYPRGFGCDVFTERCRVAATSRRIGRANGRDRQRDDASFVAHAKAYRQPFAFSKL